jgi:tRNA A37 threonylcarbamoyladenosine dehydratase
VGGHCAEALIRSGVGAVDLFDADVFVESNLNRQLFATRNTLGERKVEAAKKRLLSIFPDVRVTAHDVFVLPENIDTIDFSAFDYVIDAIDTVAGKVAIIEAAHKCGVPVISSMGAGNKLDPTAFRVADIEKTRVCPLARAVRTLLRKKGVRGVKAVYSEELPVEKKEAGSATGSLAFVPSVAGLILAGEVVKDIALK